MATEGSVLAVIRASRPQFRSPQDRVAFAVHAVFLSQGYSLTACGSRVSPDPQGDTGNVEVGIDGWNDMEDAYAFHYSGAGQDGLCKAVVVKCLVLGELLMVDAISAESKDGGEPLHAEFIISDYVTDAQGNNYGQLYKNLGELVGKINSAIVSKLSNSKESTSTTRKDNSKDDSSGEEHTRGYSSILAEPPSSMHGIRSPPIPVIGGNDLLPGPGAGVYPGRVDPVGGGMLLGPNDPRWGLDGGYGFGGFPQGGSATVPPGARFDPFGPPGVPGFEPDRFTGRRPRGGTHPDLEHFQPF